MMSSDIPSLPAERSEEAAEGLQEVRLLYQQFRARILDRARRFDLDNQAAYHEILAEADAAFLRAA